MVTPKISTMPNKPKTPIRNFRAPAEIWEAAQAVAVQRGETMTDVLLRALAEYVRAWEGSRDAVGGDE